MANTHWDGLRVCEERPTADERVLLLMHAAGDVHTALGTINTTDLSTVPVVQQAVVQAGHAYLHYLSTAIVRGLQLGVTLDTIDAIVQRIRELAPTRHYPPELPLVGIEVEDSFEMMFRDGDDYLRVVEDQYTERLTAAQLQELMEERQR